jgi:hypothetical protein
VIRHEFLREQGILILKPEGPLRAEDFTALAGVVDPYLEEKGELKGLMVEATSFPGWDDFAALTSHLRFVRDHHRRIRRIALVTDSKAFAVAPKIASQFVSAEIRTFTTSERDAALAWLASAEPPAKA